MRQQAKPHQLPELEPRVLQNLFLGRVVSNLEGGLLRLSRLCRATKPKDPAQEGCRLFLAF